jgi:hypothetical protein
MEPALNQKELKNIIKAALIEVFEERQDLLQNAIEEALEDVALIRAIKEGENTAFASRGKVITFLEGKA